MREPLKRPDRNWDECCHWCGAPATKGCLACGHTFCDECWPARYPCPRCCAAGAAR